MMGRNPLPDAEYLRSLFIYEPYTGVLRWKIDRSNKRSGDIAGAKRGDAGYLQVSIDNRLYRVHLVIWKMVTGEEPVNFIDHEDTVKFNNRWHNLRDATKSQNQANIGVIGTNTTGHKNVFWYKAYQKWVVQVWKDGASYFGGYHATLDAAEASADRLRVQLFGEFARAA